MEQEVLCIDDSFPADYMTFYKAFGVVTPTKGKIYGVRDVVKHSMGAGAGQVGLLLDELKNPEVPIDIAPLGKTKREPTWNIKRFAHLDGTALEADEVKEWERQHQLFKNLNF